jgi:hypothetical protein
MCFSGGKNPDKPSTCGAVTPCPSPPATINSGLGSEVDKLIEKSLTLKKIVEDLLAKGWKLQYGPADKGYYTDKSKKTIVVNPDPGNPAHVVQQLSHEAGHANYTADPYVPPTGLSKEQYVKANVARDLKDEGEATLNNAQVRDEIMKNGGPDIGIAGSQPAKYEEIYKKYPDPKDRDKARQEIGDAYGKGEVPSIPGSKNYEEYYSKSYESEYDKQSKTGK